MRLLLPSDAAAQMFSDNGVSKGYSTSNHEKQLLQGRKHPFISPGALLPGPDAGGHSLESSLAAQSQGMRFPWLHVTGKAGKPLPRRPQPFHQSNDTSHWVMTYPSYPRCTDMTRVLSQLPQDLPLWTDILPERSWTPPYTHTKETAADDCVQSGMFSEGGSSILQCQYHS